MTYKVSNITGRNCLIMLIPENEVDKKLLTMVEEEFTFHTHYQMALSKHVDSEATFVDLASDDDYPTSVVVNYAIARGIGGI